MCPPRQERAPATSDPIALRIRERRLQAGLSLAQLSSHAGLSAASHILHIENGSKCPSEAVAVRLATALGDDVELYRDWARARSRSDLSTALLVASRLASRLTNLGLTWEAQTAPSSRDAARPPAASAPERRQEPGNPRPTAPGLLAADSTAMLRIPVIPAGEDPGDGILPPARVLRTLRLDPGLLPSLEWIRRPFAYVIVRGETSAGDSRRHAVISRQFEILLDRSRGAEAARNGPRFAVRTRGGVILVRAHWNGEVLRRADDGEPRDYAADANRLREIVIGTVVLEIRGE